MLIKDNQKYIFAKKKITPHTHIYIHRWMDGSMMLYTEEERERLTHILMVFPGFTSHKI